MADTMTKGKLNTIKGIARKQSAKLATRTSLGTIGKGEHRGGNVQGPNGKSNSSYEMLSWQLKTLLGQIQQIELHESGDCPCILNTEDPPERCLGKHLLNISTLSRETADMSSRNKEWLLRLAGEANERHEQFKRFICHTDGLPHLTEWARNWRKQYIEPIYYICEVQPPDETTLKASPTTTGKLHDRLNTPIEMPAPGQTANGRWPARRPALPRRGRPAGAPSRVGVGRGGRG